MNAPILEIAVATARDAEIAVAAGADRLELSCALACGGLTPSLGTFLEVRKAVAVPIVVLLRPRAGGFVYRGRDVDTIQRDLHLFKDHGAAALVVGALTDRGEIDFALCEALIREARDCPLVFHRAFDMVNNPVEALEQLIGLGFRRVLTSGQEKTAWEGVTLLRQLNEQARGRIEILPGAGVGPENAAGLLKAIGCSQIHASARKLRTDESLKGFAWLGLGMPGAEGVEETDGDKVRALRRALDRYHELRQATSSSE